MVLGKLDSYMQKNETWPLSHTINKNKLQMGERPWCETGIHQNSTGEDRQQPIGHQPKQIFHDTSSKARETKDKMNLWDFIKIQSFCTAKETIKKMKRQPTEWEKILANDTTDRRPVSKINNKLLNHNKRKTKKSKNGQKIWTDTFPMKSYKWLTDTWKNFQNH